MSEDIITIIPLIPINEPGSPSQNESKNPDASLGKSCIMNKLKILNPSVTYSTCSCFLCPELKENICSECMFTCHKTHSIDVKNLSEKIVNITACHCSCAEINHNVSCNDVDYDKLQSHQSTFQCTVNEVLHHSNVDYYYMDPANGTSYWCIYCFINCSEKWNSKHEFIKKNRKMLSSSPPMCNCGNRKNHGTWEDNIYCLEKMLKDSSFEKYINLNQIPGNLLNKKVLVEKYLQPIITVHKSISDAYSNKTLNKDKHQGWITKVYRYSLRLLRVFTHVFLNYNLQISNPVIISTFNFEFLSFIFPDIDDSSGVSFKNESFWIETKINSWYFYRKFYMEPVSKIKKPYDVSSDCENTNPIHRLIAKREFNEFWMLLQVGKEPFRSWWVNCFKNIVRFIENEDTYDIEEMKITSLILEFLDWCIIWGSLRYTQSEDVESFYKETLILNFNNMVTHARNRKILVKEIKKRIETFVKLTIININDEIFYREVLCQEEYKPVPRENEEQEQEEYKSGIWDIISIKNIFTGGNSLNSAVFGGSSREQFIELAEEVQAQPNENSNQHVRDGYNWMNAYCDITFSFEKGELQESWIRSLFAFKRDTKENESEIKSWEIYDWWISEEDFYIENWKSFTESEQDNHMNELRELMLPLHLINVKMYFSNQQAWETLWKYFEQIDKLKAQYFDSHIEENYFQACVIKVLSETKACLVSTLNGNSDRIDRRNVQLYWFKYGCFDCLFNIYSIFSTNNYHQSHTSIDTWQEIYSLLCEILHWICENNVLLVSVFFTLESWAVFFPEVEEKPVLRIIKDEFYYKLLQIAIHNNYKLNWYNYTCRQISIYRLINETVNTIDNFQSSSWTEISCLIKSWNKSIQLSTKQAAWKTNHAIKDFILTCIHSDLYLTWWSNYKLSFNEKSWDKGNSKPEEQRFILSFFKLINTLGDYSFYWWAEEIPKYEIKQLLEENIHEMEPNQRRIWTMTYARYYVTSPFMISPTISNINMDVMCEQPDNNLNGRVIPTQEEKSNVEKSPVHNKGQRSKWKHKTWGENKSKNQTYSGKGGSDTNNQNWVYSPNRFKTANTGDPSLGLDPIFTNWIKYKRHMKLYYSTYFREHPWMFIKYFTDVIWFPSSYSLYKIWYFSPMLSANYKYWAYKMTYLFLECFKYFTETIFIDQYKFLHNDKYKSCVKNYFIAEKNNQEITDFIRVIKDKLAGDVQKIGNDPKFEPLKTQQLLDYYFKYIKYIKILDFFPCERFSIAKTLHNIDHQAGVQGSFNNDPNSTDWKRVSSRELAAKEWKEKWKDFIGYYSEHKENVDENVLVNIFQETTGEDDMRTQEFKNTVILDLLFRVNFSKKPNEKYPTEKEGNYILVNCINKVFKADPDLWHEVISDISFQTKLILKEIIQNQLTYWIQFIYIDFHKLDKKSTDENKDNPAINSFLILLEYLRWHCENHHKIFQTILTNANISKTNENGFVDRLDLVNFILKIPVMAKKNANYSEGKREWTSMFKKPNTKYYNTLLTGVTDYLIEIIQGSFESNMRRFCLNEDYSSVSSQNMNTQNTNDDNVSSTGNVIDLKPKMDSTSSSLPVYRNNDFDNYIESGYLCFDNLDSEESEFFLAQFFRFIICFFEESLNPKSNKEKIVKKFNPKKWWLGLAHSTSNLYLHYCENKRISNDYSLPETFHGDWLNWYLTEEDIQDNYYFILSSNIFRFFRMAVQWKSGDKVNQYWKDLKIECETNQPIGEKNRNYIIAKREAFRFYTKIVKEVEIFYKPKETISELERRKFKEFFNTPEEFEKNEKSFQQLAMWKGNVQKVVYLIHSDSLFVQDQDMINFTIGAPFEKNWKLNYLLKYIPRIENDIQMRKQLWEKGNKIWSWLYKVNYSYMNYISIFLAVVVNILVLFSSFYEIRVESSEVYTPDFTPKIIKIRKDTNIKYTFIVSWIHWIFIALVLTNWLFFMILHLRAIKVKAKWTIPKIVKLIADSEVFPLGWNFLIGFVAWCSVKFNFIYSLQWFTVFTLFETMQTVIYSVRIKYRQFLSAGLLMMIFSLFFAMVKFYWFTTSESDDCKTFNQCFWSIVTEGIRGGGGMGFPTKSINEDQYYSEFFFEWVFYFSIILILWNVINGIIVDTFQALREQSNAQYETKMNVCFICSLNRNIFERLGWSFEEHKDYEHYILNYFHYIFKILKADEQELNSWDYQVLLSYNQEKTDFFPVKTALVISDQAEE